MNEFQIVWISVFVPCWIIVLIALSLQADHICNEGRIRKRVVKRCRRGSNRNSETSVALSPPAITAVETYTVTFHY